MNDYPRETINLKRAYLHLLSYCTLFDTVNIRRGKETCVNGKYSILLLVIIQQFNRTFKNKNYFFF